MTYIFQTFLNVSLFIIQTFALAFVLGGCQSPPTELRVLEKSRQVEPDWVKHGAGLRSSYEGLDYVTLKDKVLDLTLGLRQIEASALYNFKYHLFQTFLKRVDMNALDELSRKDFTRKLSKMLDAELNVSNVKDFYFDKISAQEVKNELIPEYYRIYALAHIESKQRTEIAEKLRAFLKSSPYPALRSQAEHSIVF
jgi:hypothetical protein